MNDDEILAELQALDDEQLEIAARLLGGAAERLEEHHSELGDWFGKLAILAQDALIRRSWSLELLADEDLDLLKRLGAIFRGTGGWVEMEGIEPFWGTVDPPTVPDAQRDLWNMIMAGAAGELDKRRAVRRDSPPT